MSRKIPSLLAWVVSALLLVSCELPLPQPPTPFVFPTPDLTLTAIFSVLVASPTPEAPPVLQPTPLPPEPSPTAEEARLTDTPTGTPEPTKTTSPTATPDLVYIRPGASVTAFYMSIAPTLDGDLGEWDLPGYPVKSVVYGRENWKDEQDLSGTVMVGWDDQYLYLGVKVVDDVYVQNATGNDLYKGDSLEILLDTRLATDFYTTDLSPDDFQLGISPGSPAIGNNSEAYLWYPRSIRGSRSTVLISAKATSDGYTLEAAIPWDTFEMAPEANRRYSFAFSISDNDILGNSIQQSMVSNVPTRRLTNPTTWGDLILLKP